MYSRIVFLILCLIVSVVVISCGIEDKARYDNYRIYRFHLATEDQVRIMQELDLKSDSFIYFGSARYPIQNLTIIAAAHKVPEIEDLCERYQITHEVLVYNLQEKIDDQWNSVLTKETPGNQLDWEHYFHLETIYDWLDLMLMNHEDLTPVILGNSYEGRSIRGVKLSRKTGNTAVFVEAGIHAREWITPATIAQNYDWFFFPIVNPDGYVYSFEKDRLWRKNRKPYGLCRGVDLNRNFNSSWNGPGSSPDPCRSKFAGSSANSEPEVEAISQWLKEHVKEARIKTYLSLHSYSQLLMFPYGSTETKVDNYDDLKEIGEKAIDALAKVHGTKYYTGSSIDTIYPSSGGSIDWVYEELGIKIPYMFELRGPPDSADMFMLPAYQISSVGEETLEAFITIMEVSQAKGYYNEGP
uniref:Zinc carboxypeptidase A 1 n=1 Tax=Phlebotomus papatasi TaxID=29031 RepID=A0A1B0DBQ1_PHLPP